MKFKGRIAVFGGRVITDSIYKDTVEIGKRMAEENWLVFCGGGEGVMEAIAKGVSINNGVCIGILKDKDFRKRFSQNTEEVKEQSSFVLCLKSSLPSMIVWA